MGKTGADYARAAEERYLPRIQRYRSARIVVVREERHDSRYTAEHRLEREGERLLAKAESFESPFLTVFDPRGKPVTSRQLAEEVRSTAYEQGRTLVIVVGGPDGISSLVRQRAGRILAMSRLTFPHDLARVVVLEQTYRALTIIHGHPYDR